jgi:acyl carrier protein
LARWRADGVLELVDRAERQGQAAAAAARAYEAPRTPVEEVIAGIWSEMLGVEPIGVHDNFFILGGHSLLATRVVARIRDVLKVELPLRALFEAPSVGELATRVDAERRVALITEGTVEEIIDDVTKMSEEEVERMLNNFIRDAP